LYLQKTIPLLLLRGTHHFQTFPRYHHSILHLHLLLHKQTSHHFRLDLNFLLRLRLLLVHLLFRLHWLNLLPLLLYHMKALYLQHILQFLPLHTPRQVHHHIPMG
jgi:hypothetical protein